MTSVLHRYCGHWPQSHLMGHSLLVKIYSTKRAEAHFRYNRMTRLWKAYLRAMSQVLADRSNLPLKFSYEEGDPPTERIWCCLWDRRSFVLHPDHSSQYNYSTINRARNRKDAFIDERNDVFLEVIDAERLEGDTPPKGFWFIDILKRGLMGQKPLSGTEQEVAERQALFRQWGYEEGNPDELLTPFHPRHQGLFTWPAEGGRKQCSGVHQASASTYRWRIASCRVTLCGGLLWDSRARTAHYDWHAHYVE